MAEQKNDRQASSRRGRTQPASEKRKSRQKEWCKEMIEAKGSDPKPVEIDGFTKSEITQQKEACPDEGYGHHQAHQRAGKQGTAPQSKAKRKSPVKAREQ